MNGCAKLIESADFPPSDAKGVGRPRGLWLQRKFQSRRIGRSNATMVLDLLHFPAQILILVGLQWRKVWE